MSINEERLKEWIEQVTKKLAHLEANQIAIINGDFCDTNTEPKEPLIKDEKIRKAVRAWAEALNEETIRFDRVSQGFSFGDGNLYSSINFDGFVFDLTDGKKYTIEELCGEEEAPEPIEPTFIDLDERVKEKVEE